MQTRFIVIEGLDGAGKSTAIEFIRQYFDSKDYEAVYTREPGGTKIAENIRNIALENHSDEVVHSDTELLLMYASRVQHINALIKPSLENGLHVVSDRFYWSSIAYQGAGRGIGLDKLEALNNSFVRDCEPDLIIYLDIDPATGLKRAQKVGDPDRIEQAGLEFFNRAREKFRALVKNSENAVEIDASLPINAIEERMYQILDDYFHF